MSQWHGGKGSAPRPKAVTKEVWAENWEKAFGNGDVDTETTTKSYKATQQDLTELNGDGNRERGRYGEDLSD